MPDPAMPTVEQTFAQTKNGFSCSEQPGVPSYPTHQPTMLVMYLALNHPLPPRAILCGGNGTKKVAGLLSSGQKEQLVGQLHVLGYTGTKKLVQRSTTDPFDEFSQQDKTEITVLAAPSWRKDQLFIYYSLEKGGSVLRCVVWFQCFEIGLISR